MFDIVMSTFPGEELLKMERNRNKWKPIVNHVMKSLDKKGRDEKDSRVCVYDGAVVAVHGDIWWTGVECSTKYGA